MANLLKRRGVKIIISILFGLSLFTFSGTVSAALTQGQIDAIVLMVQSFGVDNATINNVRASLSGTAPVLTQNKSSVASSSLGSSTLRIGSRGESVRQLQTFLGINPDGVFGTGTQAQVMDWQRRNGLTPDGVVGPAMISIIEKKDQSIVFNIPTDRSITSPVISYFTANGKENVTIKKGEAVSLSWKAENVVSCYGYPAWYEGDLTGVKVMYPNYATVYTLTCLGSNQSTISKKVNVNVEPTSDVLSSCNINSFTASSYDITAGAEVILNWSTNDKCVSLGMTTNNGSIAPVPSGQFGNAYVSPPFSTTYTLYASPLGGVSVTKSVTVNVTPANTTIVPLVVLNVNSSDGSKIPISGSISGTSGTTNYTITESAPNIIETNLTAPDVAGKTFSSWSGCNYVNGRVCSVIVSLVSTPKTVTANYLTSTTTSGTLSIDQVSSILALLQSFGGSTAMVANVQLALTGSTPATPTYSSTLTTTQVNAILNLLNSFGANANIIANVKIALTGVAISTTTEKATLNVNSSGATGVTITALSPSDAGGTANYSRSYSTAITSMLLAPATSGTATFSSWSGCDSNNNYISGIGYLGCVVGINLGSSRTVTANYLTPTTPTTPTTSSGTCSSLPCTFDGKAITNTWASVDVPPAYVSYPYPYELYLPSDSPVSMTLRSNVWPSLSNGSTNTMTIEIDNKVVFQQTKTLDQYRQDESSNNTTNVIQLGQLSAGKHYIKIYASPDPKHMMFDYFVLDKGVVSSIPVLNSGLVANALGAFSSTNLSSSENISIPFSIFKVGNKVKVKNAEHLSVRVNAGVLNESLGTQSRGSIGVLIEGPEAVEGQLWWKVNYDNGTDGWSVEKYLEVVK